MPEPTIEILEINFRKIGSTDCPQIQRTCSHNTPEHDASIENIVSRRKVAINIL